MTHPLKAAITGVHGYVPEYILTNDELATMVDTTDEWITTRTGIKERRILKGEGRGTSEMGIEAVKGLLQKTGTAPGEVDLLLCATVTPDYVFPATANLIAHACKLGHKPSFDVNVACSGFLYALTIGAQFIESGMYRKVIVVGADKMSAIIDYTDRTTCVLFGDGAGAVLLEPNREGYGLLDSVMHSDGAGVAHLYQPAGGSKNPPTCETVRNRQHFAKQDGPSVFKFAVVRMAEVSAEVMERNQLRPDDVAWLVPHQANKRIISATADRMGIGMDKVMLNIQRYGNTTAATIPLCLWDYESQLNKGDNLVLAAFGGGFTWGAAYVKWAYEP